MKRNGRNSSGTQRWRCRSCGASATHTHDSDAKRLKAFLGWLLSGSLQKDMPGEGRTFRRRCARFWEIWPLPPVCDEAHRVVYVDGIYLARGVVVLIARSDDHVIGWYLARSENSRAWRALMSRIAPPDMVVTDGGPGFEKARRREWPDTKVQRCTFHAFCQVRRHTTSRPKLQAGAELYGLAKDLPHAPALKEAEAWVEAYLGWGAGGTPSLPRRPSTRTGGGSGPTGARSTRRPRSTGCSARASCSPTSTRGSRPKAPCPPRTTRSRAASTRRCGRCCATIGACPSRAG